MQATLAGAVGKKTAQLFFCLLAIAALAFAQNSRPGVHRALRHDISPPLRELALSSLKENEAAVRGKEPDAAQAKENTSFKDVPFLPWATSARNAQPTSLLAASTVNVTSLLNFDGLTDLNSWSVPDSDGVVGDTQYVQWTNVEYAVYDKGTGRKLLGPILGKSLWAGFGGACQNANSGDPVAQFDKIAHRWVLTQHATPTGGPYYDCVAISTTSDATGSYYRYAFNFTSYYPDYPKLGVWPDAYYLTLDELNPATGYSYVDAMACALDRAAMLKGAAAQAVCFTTSGPSYRSLLPADMDGTIAPPAGSPNYMMNLGTNALNLWRFHVDFQTTSNSTFTGPIAVPVNSFVKACNGQVCIPQAGVTQTVDSLADRLMWRLAYRRFSDGHESLVTNHAIGSGVAEVRWYEIQNPAGTPQIVQQNTLNQDGNYRWLGSMAMDQMGNIAMGYSESSSSMNPAIFINGRLASDPLNTMEGELLVFAGTGSQSGSNRWGDYSSMTVDPNDDCTFWYTNQYLPTTGSFNWNTRITSFKFPDCSIAEPAVTLAPATLFFNSQAIGTTSAGQTITLTNNQSVALQISNITASGDYTETDNCPSTVAASGTCVITVKFSPTAAGTRTGQVAIADDAGNSPQIANLTGTGTAPTAALSSSHLFFGVHAVGTTSSVQTVTVTNKGLAPLNVNSVTVSGGYSESDTCQGNAVAPGSSCTVNVQFVPSVLGVNNGWITLYDNVLGAPQLIEANGSGNAPLGLNPATFAFGTVNVGSDSTPQILTLTNYLPTTLNLSYAATGSYVVASGGSNPCGTSLAGGAQCTLNVTFSPTTSGVINGAVSLVYNAGNSPLTAGLFGTGSGGPAPPLSFQLTSLSFGSVLQGTTSAAKTVLVTNVSGAPITFSSVTASGDFSVSGCSGTLNAGKQCQITVKFTPTVAATVYGAVTFKDNAAVSPQTIYLNGVGLLPVTVAPVTLTFAGQTVGTTSAPQTVTISNHLGTAVALSGFSASGEYSVRAAGSAPCGASLAAKASCTVQVTFSPLAKGAIGGAMTLVHSANTSPQIVELNGTGQ